MTTEQDEPKTRLEYAMEIRACIGVIEGAQMRLERALQDLSVKDGRAYMVKLGAAGAPKYRAVKGNVRSVQFGSSVIAGKRA